jgi:hypothetical protein
VLAITNGGVPVLTVEVSCPVSDAVVPVIAPIVVAPSVVAPAVLVREPKVANPVTPRVELKVADVPVIAPIVVAPNVVVPIVLVNPLLAVTNPEKVAVPDPVILPMVDAPNVLDPSILVKLFPITTPWPEVLLIFKSTPSLLIVFKYDVILGCREKKYLFFFLMGYYTKWIKSWQLQKKLKRS